MEWKFFYGWSGRIPDNAKGRRKFWDSLFPSVFERIKFIFKENQSSLSQWGTRSIHTTFFGVYNMYWNLRYDEVMEKDERTYQERRKGSKYEIKEMLGIREL